MERRRQLAASLTALLFFAFAACGTVAPVTPERSSDGGGADGALDDERNDALVRPGGNLCTDAPPDLETSKKRAQSCGLGDEAPLLVRGSPYTKVLVEVAATKSARPSQTAIDHLRALMQDLLDKPGGVSVKVDAPIDDVGHAVTLAEVRAIEDRSRTAFAEGDTAVFYYLVVSEASVDDTSSTKILGYAYRPSSMVVFQKSIQAVSGGLGQPSRDTVETTVVAHEFGHVLGLVNTGAPLQSPHEDSAHPKHDVNTKCLMYYANNSSELVTNLLGGGMVPDFDDACRADLAALKR